MVTTIRVPTVAAAERYLWALGFRQGRLTDWTNAAGDVARVYPILRDGDDAVLGYCVEITPAQPLPPASRASHYS